MNILVTGANGQLGRHFRLLAPKSAHRWLFTDVEELDITNPSAIEAYVTENSVGLIINCAAYTNVDQAESDEARALCINSQAVANLASAMKAVDGRLIHFSTDYVFGGNANNTPCTEDQHPNPTGAYGRTKLAGEQAASGCKSLIIRTSWLYSEYGKNFLLTMRRLTDERPEVRVVFDQVGTPTYAGDLAAAVFTIVENGAYLQHEGVFHFANEGVCSWYDFAIEIARLSGHQQCRVLPCHSNEFPSPVTRPSYSVLDKTKFKNTFNQSIPHWTDALRRCIDNLC